MTYHRCILNMASPSVALPTSRCQLLSSLSHSLESKCPTGMDGSGLCARIQYPNHFSIRTTEWVIRNGFRFAAHKCKAHFTAPRAKVQRPPNLRIGNTLLPVEEPTKFLGLWWDFHPSYKKCNTSEGIWAWTVYWNSKNYSCACQFGSVVHYL